MDLTRLSSPSYTKVAFEKPGGVIGVGPAVDVRVGSRCPGWSINDGRRSRFGWRGDTGVGLGPAIGVFEGVTVAVGVLLDPLGVPPVSMTSYEECLSLMFSEWYNSSDPL